VPEDPRQSYTPSLGSPGTPPRPGSGISASGSQGLEKMCVDTAMRPLRGLRLAV
jgi:hypothetical protein